MKVFAENKAIELYQKYLLQVIFDELNSLFEFFRYYHITFLEVNPLAVTKNGFIPFKNTLYLFSI